MSEIFAVIFGTIAAIWVALGFVILTSHRTVTKLNVTEEEQSE